MPDLSILPVFMLVFTRCSAFLVASPLFAIPGIPPVVKSGFAFILAVIIYPLAARPGLTAADSLWGYGLMVLSEAAVGLAMGIVCTMVFNALRMAGQMIDLQIGYAMSQMMDPVSGSMNTLLGRFLYFLSLAALLCMDGHHGLIWGLAKSYQVLPLNSAEMSGDVAVFVIRVFADTITMALKVAIPVISVLLMTDIALGVMGRTAPQMNIFMLGFPFKIMLGLVSLAVLLPLMGSILAAVFDRMQKDLILLVKGLS
ncbi:flagellar biosynthetic protein FliR [Desulfohalotomaculum tongense]|nr:flagellar biosynthetic protein FliR [Desulforadius tongensis]MBM7854223.1 flagellar biosynthetic protein FliR [Desulforadius tongensis]